MADNLERLVLDILLRDRASDGLGRASRAAESAAESVSGLNKRLEEVGRKTAEARVKLAGDKEAQAALDRLDAKLLTLDRRTASSRLTVEGAARAIAELGAVDAELDKLGGKGGTAEAATSSLGAGGLAGPAGMGALIGAGVALSPVIVTLGTGLAGLGAAASKTIAPILEAGTATAKARKELAGLDPAQRAAYDSLGRLKTQFSGFAKSLEPETLGLFAGGLRLASHLMHDVQPVAAATGKALDGLLGRIDAEFQSGTWKNFFTWMAQQAGPDVKLLGDSFVQLLHTLPPLLEDLQPLAAEMLTVTDNTLKLTNAVVNFGKSNDKVSQSVGTNTGLLGFLSKAVANVTSFLHPGGVAAGALKTALDGIPDSAGKAGSSLGGVAKHAYTLAQQLAADRAAVNALTDAENKALSPLLAYSNALIAQQNDAVKLNDALKKSHDRIGLNTDVQRASFSAANTYIQDLLNTASAAVKSHQGIDAQISSIRGALPQLQNVRGGTRLYWQEVSTLVGWLHRLQQIKLIQEAIHVSGTGIWTVTPGKIGLPGGSAGGPFASGGLVTAGTGPRSDDVLARVSKGELVVPANMVSAGVVDHLRGMLPGFASGGVVGSWPQLPGMGPWAGRELRATESAIGRSVAQALIAGIKAAAAAAASGTPGALGGPTSASASQAQAYASSRLGAYGWSAAQMKPLILLWNQESGWNRFARNPSSGAYGIPQALPPGKMGAAANPPTSSAAAQINWGLGYIRGRYGSPAGAWGHEVAFNWYDSGGFLPPGASVAMNGTGRPERVGGPAVVNYNITVLLPPGSDREQGRRIVGYIKAFEKGSGAGWRK